MITYFNRGNVMMYGAVQINVRIFHLRTKYACAPRMIKPRAKKPHNKIPASGLYLGPTNSEASTNVDTIIPGIKKPMIKRVMM